MGFSIRQELRAVILTMLFFSLPLSAASADEPVVAPPAPVHGFLQGNYSLDTGGKNPDGGNWKWAQETIQLRLDESGEKLRFFLKGDASYDHVDDSARVELREGYAGYASGKWDLRAGRQIITWGHGDLVFVSDVFPKDYEAFFSGRPLEYLKKGVDGVKAGIYPDAVSIEVIAIPFFEPNNLPRAGRFRMFDSMPGAAGRVRSSPAATISNTEIAARAYRDIAGYEAAVYFYRGFFRNPSMRPDNPAAPRTLTLFYPRLNVYGASLQGSGLDGVLSLEAGYYDSRQDRAGVDPFVPNSAFKFLALYQRQIGEDLTLGLQYYAECMSGYAGYSGNSPAGLPKDRRLRELLSARLTRLMNYQTLKLSLFSFYSTTDGDYLVNPEVNYKFTDSVWASAGGNFFGGKPWTQFGSLDKDDNVYLQVRREF